MTNKLNKDEIFLKLKELEFAIKKVKDCESLFVLAIKTKAIINEYNFFKAEFDNRVSEFKRFKKTKEYSYIMLDLIRESNIFSENEIELKCDFSNEKSEIYCDLFNPDLIWLDDGLDWPDSQDYHLQVLSNFINNANIKPSCKKHVDALGLYWYYAGLVEKNEKIKLFNPYYDLSEKELMCSNPPVRENYLQSHADFYFLDNFICNEWFDSPICISGHRVKNIDILLKIALSSVLFQLQIGLENKIETKNQKTVISDKKTLDIRLKVDKSQYLKKKIEYIKDYLNPKVERKLLIKRYHKNAKSKNPTGNMINTIVTELKDLGICDLLDIPKIKYKTKNEQGEAIIKEKDNRKKILATFLDYYVEK